MDFVALCALFWIQDLLIQDPKGVVMTPPATESSIVTVQPEPPEETAARRPMWELAECNCPEFCERDHELD